MSRRATFTKPKPGAGGPASLSTVAADWLGAAIPALDGSRRGRDEVVHNLRTAAKRARALVRLLGDALGVRARRRENLRLRDAARALAGTRDAAVARALLLRLRHQHRGRTRVAIASVLRGLAQPPAAAPEARGADAAIAHAHAALHAAVGKLRGLRLPPADARKVVEIGLRASYRRSRHQMRLVRSGGDAAACHEWRKLAKRLFYQLQLPGLAKSKAVRRMVRRLDELQEQLGAEHDAQLVMALLRSAPARLGGTKHAMRVAALLERRGEKLRARCLRLGMKVFADQPAAFAKGIRRRLRRLRAGVKPA